MTRPQALLAVSLAFVATAVYAVMWVGHSQDSLPGLGLAA